MRNNLKKKEIQTCIVIHTHARAPYTIYSPKILINIKSRLALESYLRHLVSSFTQESSSLSESVDTSLGNSYQMSPILDPSSHDSKEKMSDNESLQDSTLQLILNKLSIIDENHRVLSEENVKGRRKSCRNY